MSYVDTDAWTCPECGETTRGTAEPRRAMRRAHARRHAKALDEATGKQAAHPPIDKTPPRPLVIPPAPRQRARRR